MKKYDSTGRSELASIIDPLSAQDNSSCAAEGRQGVRLNYDEPSVRGHRDVVAVREGLVTCIGDLNHLSAHDEVYLGEDVTKFHFRLKGGSQVITEQGDTNDVVPQSCGVLVQPGGFKKTELFNSGQNEQSVTLFCNPSFLDVLLEDSGLFMPQPIVRLIKGQAADYFCLGLPMPPEMLSTVRGMFDISLAGHFRALQIEAKSLELMCQMLKHIASAAGDDRNRALRKRDIERVAEVCDILDSNFSSTPKISDLAKQVGWNETQLAQVFREVMGVTVFDYRHRAAMEYALELIKDPNRSIGEVSYQAGYEYPSNFSTAFRKQFGMTPVEARKRLLNGLSLKS